MKRVGFLFVLIAGAIFSLDLPQLLGFSLRPLRSSLSTSQYNTRSFAAEQLSAAGTDFMHARVISSAIRHHSARHAQF